jgi:hypothetical protein
LQARAKTALGILALCGLVAATAVVAYADSAKARFGAAGAIVYVGPSIVPGAPTTSSTEFRLKPDGSVAAAIVTTQNEQVIGVLGSPALTHCSDHDAGATCAQVEGLLGGATVNSLHTSVARLRVQSQGPGPGGFEVISGMLQGQLDSALTIVTGAGPLAGNARLRIGQGSTGVYACFLVVPSPAPCATIAPCIAGTPGFMMFPVVLGVVDSGRFEVTDWPASFTGEPEMRGKVEVAAAGPIGLVSGSLTISDAKFEAGDGDDGDGD